MNICYICDDNFAVCAGVSIVSVIENSKEIEEINFFVLDDGISDANKKKMQECVYGKGRKIIFLSTGEKIRELKNIGVETWRGKYSVYLKLLISDFFPNTMERLIVMDADTIVDGSIEELDRINLNGHPCAMAYEGVCSKYHQYTGLGKNGLYNTGVIVYDLMQWRKKRIEQKFITHLIDINNRYLLPEEDPISLILLDDVEILNPKYNFITQFYLYSTDKYFKRYGWGNIAFYSLGKVLDAKNDVCVYHCIDTFTNRPWHRNNIHPYTDIYDMYLQYTPWKCVEKKVFNMNRIQKLEYALRKILPTTISNYFYFLSSYLFYTIKAKKFYKKVSKLEVR